MSTSLNDVVRELYKEVKTQTEFSMERKRPRLLRLYSKPSLLLLWIKHLFRYICYHYGRVHFMEKKSGRILNKIDDFMPTQKVFPDIKIAVYTAITGGYDELRDPIYVDDNIDYYAFTDSVIHTNGGGGMAS